MTAASGPVRPPRDTRLDVLRGWMQVSIFISHAAGTVFFLGIHAAWGLSDSSEQFLMLSGLALGSVFALKQHRVGFAGAWRDLGLRIARLWRTHVVVFLLFGTLVIWAERIAGLPGEIARLNWTLFAEHPLQALAGGAVLLHQPAFMGIFPTFLFGMALLPLVVWGAGRYGARVLLPSVALYALAQWTGPLIPGIGGTEIAFDPLSWQLLFVIGVWIGRAALLGEAGVPRHALLTAGAVGMVLLGLWVRLVEHDVAPGFGFEAGLVLGKEHLALPRLLHALSLAYLVAHFVPRSARWMETAPAQAMAAIGRNSLQAFSFGLFLSYLFTVAVRVWPDRAMLLDAPLIATGIVALVIYARAIERRRVVATARRVPA